MRDAGVSDAENSTLKAECDEHLARVDAQLASLYEKRAALKAKLPKAPEPKFVVIYTA